MRIENINNFLYVTKSNLKIVLSCLGASIVEIKYDDDLLTMTPINYNDLNREDIYYGKTIGPIANRIKDGLIKIDNKNYYLPLNEKGISNHSGKAGLSNQMFDVSIKEEKVIFTYKTHMFDGDITFNVIYSFTLDNQIKIDYEVRTTNKALLSLTNHTFFTLGESCVDYLSINVDANQYIECDRETLLPLSIRPVTERINLNGGTYDNCFLLKDKRVVLESTKYQLIIQSDFPCVQIYTDNFEDGILVKNASSKTRRAIAIEPEDNLLEKTLINKDEIYHRYIIYSFNIK